MSVNDPRALARQTSRDERLARGVHVVGGVLRLEPFEQVLHPALERDLCAEAKSLAGKARVGVAVTDVAGAVLVDDLRLDVLAEPVRDRLRDAPDRRRLAG